MAAAEMKAQSITNGAIQQRVSYEIQKL